MTDKDQVDVFLEKLEGNKAARARAMMDLSEKDDLSRELVLELTPRIVHFATEGNRLEENRAGNILREFAREQPGAVAQGFDKEQEFIPEENEDAAKDIMNALFEVEENNQGILAGEMTEVDSFLQSRSQNIRHDAAKLLGYFATPTAVEDLDRLRRERGADKALYRGASIGLENAAERAISSLGGTGPLSQAVAVSTLEAIVEADVRILADHCVSLLTGLETKFYDRVTEIIVEIVDSQSGSQRHTTACDVAEEAMDLFEEHVKNAGTVVIEMCRCSSDVAQIVAERIPVPESRVGENSVHSLDSVSRRLVSGLQNDRYRNITECALRERIRFDDLELQPLLRELVALLPNEIAGRSAAELAGCIAIENPRLVREAYDEWLQEHLLENATPEQEQYVRRELLFFRFCANSQETLAKAVVQDVVDEILPMLDEIPEELVAVLERANDSVPKEVAQRSVQIAPLLDSQSVEVRQRGVAVLGEAIDSDTSCPPTVLERMLASLEDPESQVQARAIAAIEQTGMYPAPPKLRDLADSDSVDEEIRARARQTLTNIEARRSDFEIDSEHLETEGTGIVDGNSDSLELRHWEDSEGWTRVDLGTLRDGLLRRIRNRRDTEPSSNIPILLPYFDPQEAVLVVIDSILQNIECAPHVILFSPGTQTQWGQKSEVRRELSRYGIASKDAGNLQATPIPEIVPDAFVSQEEIKDRTDGTTGARLVLTKRLGEILTLDPREIDEIVLNFSARTKGEWSDQLDRLDDKFPDTTSTTIYSSLTKNEIEQGRPTYGPPEFLTEIDTLPDVDTLESVITAQNGDKSTEGQSQIRDRREGSAKYDTDSGAIVDELLESSDDTTGGSLLGDPVVQSLTEGSEIRITEVEAPQIRSLLEQTFQNSARLEDVDDRGGSHRIFGEQMFFERLPVPVRHHDEWIREQWNAGEYMLPKISRERLENLETFGSQVDNLEVVEPVFDAKEYLQMVRNKLEDENPLFEEVIERAHQSIENRERLAVLVPTPSWADMLRRAFEYETAIQLESGHGYQISIETPDTIREVRRLDSLVIPGPLHPQHSAYYVYPRTDTVEVLTYNRHWTAMIERHASEYINLLNAATARRDFTPFTKPNVVGDTEPVSEQETDYSDSDEEPPAAPADSPTDLTTPSVDDDGEDTLDLLARAMERTSNTEYTESKSRYEREYQTYRIQLDSNTTVRGSNHERVLRRKREVKDDESEFHWISAEVLSQGDQIVYIPEEVERDLWRDHLHNLYVEEINRSAVSDLETWYETIDSIRSEVDDQLSLNVEKEVIDVVYRKCRDAGLDRRKQTLASWFEAVQEADGPLDLVKDPSLTIGPRRADDIRVIGDAFDRDELSDHYENLERAMRGFRTVNRQEGREFQKWLKNQFTSDEENRIRRNAEIREVQNIVELSNDERNTTSETN